MKLNNLESHKKYAIISGFNIYDNNRGTAALSYGAINFLEEKKILSEKQELINIRIYKNPFRKEYHQCKESTLLIAGKNRSYLSLYVSFIEVYLLKYFNIIMPFTKFGKHIKKIDFVAAINGGDGFSDIYNTVTFKSRLPETLLALKLNIPLIILPQTLGPFKEKKNYNIAKHILKYAHKIYIRDKQFISELEKMSVKYELTKDLSYYMHPQPFDIAIKQNAIGINISGLTYFNHFRELSHQFENYPILIDELIKYFQSEESCTIYLIPHSYNYNKPEIDNDDLLAAREVYDNLHNKSNIVLIDKDLISPQIKYLISQMTFFIGTRMHANFAAIYTGIPVYGLSYSYKFQGAFEENGINNSTSTINHISKREAQNIARIICEKYKKQMHN